jgi:hypothetical protein
MIGRAQLSEVEEHLEGEHGTGLFQQLADETEIRRVVDEIDNACDEKDWERLRTFFADEVDADFTSLAGSEPAKIKADDLVDGWKTNLFQEKKTFHQRSNYRIEIRGDRAEVFSKGYAFNLLESGEVQGLWEVWGNYTHSLRRMEDGWKVLGMTLEVIYQRGDQRVRTFVPESV